jgi:hypothetical protein
MIVNVVKENAASLNVAAVADACAGFKKIILDKVKWLMIRLLFVPFSAFPAL